jgi:phage shock protein A
MGLFDNIARVVKANINDLVNKAEDPEKMLEQSLLEMQENLVQLRQGVAGAIAAQKRTEQQMNQAENNANEWLRKAQLAVQKGEDDLARQALERKKTFAETALTLRQSWEQQTKTVETLKQNLQGLEAKIMEAKTKKDMLKARITAAKAQEQIGGMIGGIDANTSSAGAAFERMEEKVLMMEARTQGVMELSGDGGLESKFKALEGGSAVDDELALLKAQNLALPQANANQPQLTGTNTAPVPNNPVQPPAAKPTGVVDAELEELRRQLNQM